MRKPKEIIPVSIRDKSTGEYITYTIGQFGYVPKEFDNVYLPTVEEDLDITLSEEQKEWQSKLDRIIKGENWCGVVIGSVGNGKTMLCCSAVNEWNQFNYHDWERHARYTTQSEIKYSTSNFREAEAFDEFCGYGVLFIDELDSDDSEWDSKTKSVVCNLIRWYYDNRDRYRLILAGNISIEDFTKMFPTRILDRLQTAEMSVFEGESYREYGSRTL